MPPPGKKRRVEDRDYLEPYNASVPTTSRARALAENKAAQVAIQQERASVRIDENGRAEPAPLIYMNQLPPSAIHAYIRHYNLVPLPLPLPQSVPTVPAPINYTQAVYPTGPVSASVLQPEQDQPPEAKDGLDTLKTPAWDGQEIGEADHRLVELARNHWDNVQLKEGETIVNFVYALRMKNKHIKMPTYV